MNKEQVLIMFALFVPIVAVVGRDRDTQTSFLNHENVPNIGNGRYFFMYENSDGTYRTELGKYETGDNKKPILKVAGSYSVLDDNGNLYIMNYRFNNNRYNRTVVKILKEENESEEDSEQITTRMNVAALGALVGGGIG